MANEIRCSYCGKKCLDTDKYCRYCNEPIIVVENTYNKPIEGIEIEKFEEFIKKNSADYIKTFRKNEGKKFFLSFNLGALIFSYYWMFYRKMYKEGLITVIVCLLLPLFIAFLCATVSNYIILYFIPLAFFFRVSIGAIGDCLYKAHCVRNLSVPVPDMSKGGISYNKALLFGLPLEIVVSCLGKLLSIIILAIFD